MKPVCVVAGVGPGNGAAFARRFASGGYAVALLARTTELTGKLASSLPDACAYPCDSHRRRLDRARIRCDPPRPRRRRGPRLQRLEVHRGRFLDAAPDAGATGHAARSIVTERFAVFTDEKARYFATKPSGIYNAYA